MAATPEQVYEPPVVIDLGSLEEITKNGGRTGGDARSKST